MAKTPLIAELSRANATVVRDTMPVLKRHWKLGSWLSKSNPYRKDSIGHINQKKKQKGLLLRGSALPQYVAASAIAHCYDGWSYLGRALEAEMAGDPDTTRHLGYYAELRAAMSVLASEGIGVFHDQHIVITGKDRSNIIEQQGATHQFVWKALEWWGNSIKGNSAVLDLIRPGGVPLSEWLDQFSAGSSFFVSSWIQQWGLDLSLLATDRSARNMASYRPTGFTTPGPRSIESIIDSILQIWEVCDPGANGGFPILDSHLLRSSLDLVWKNQSPTGGKNYEQTLLTTLNGISPTGHPLGPWDKFLSQQCLADKHPVVDSASGNVDAHHLDHSKQVLARAILLLRIATGRSAELLGEAGPDGVDALEFWTSGASVRRRLWPESSPGVSPVDLWPDVEDALESVRQWIENGGPRCHHTLWTKRGTEASLLATVERAFLWGVGL